MVRHEKVSNTGVYDPPAGCLTATAGSKGDEVVRNEEAGIIVIEAITWKKETKERESNERILFN